MVGPEESLGELLVWSAGAGAHPEIVRLALPHLAWRRDDPRWWWMLWHPLSHDSIECYRFVLPYCNPDARLFFGRTILHDVAGIHGRDNKGDGVAFAKAVLDAGGSLNIRDDLLKSTPLGWACRWGLVELVKLFLDRSADPVEADAEPWATPRAWAEKRRHAAVLALLPR
jgi:hypothetical protein